MRFEIIDEGVPQKIVQEGRGHKGHWIINLDLRTRLSFILKLFL